MASATVTAVGAGAGGILGISGAVEAAAAAAVLSGNNSLSLSSAFIENERTD